MPPASEPPLPPPDGWRFGPVDGAPSSLGNSSDWQFVGAVPLDILHELHALSLNVNPSSFPFFNFAEHVIQVAHQFSLNVLELFQMVWHEFPGASQAQAKPKPLCLVLNRGSLPMCR